MRAKKHLGQHFLKSKQALASMVAVGEVTKGDLVVEIGPGKGILTEALLDTGATVIAIEKDTDLIPYLYGKFEGDIESGKLTLIETDILDVDPIDLKTYGETYKLVANIPYYITGAIVRHFLSSSFQPTAMVLLVQKEVAQRIVARDSKESILSLSVKAYGTPRYVEKVSKKMFSPPPKVDSAILAIENISKNFFDTVTEEEYFRFIKQAFGQRRKQLLNNFADKEKEALKKTLETLGIPRDVRAEDLTLLEIKKIVEESKRRPPL